MCIYITLDVEMNLEKCHLKKNLNQEQFYKEIRVLNSYQKFVFENYF